MKSVREELQLDVVFVDVIEYSYELAEYGNDGVLLIFCKDICYLNEREVAVKYVCNRIPFCD